jgi:hypothetical protein
LGNSSEISNISPLNLINKQDIRTWYNIDAIRKVE